jgi:hypothetical protein
MATHAHQVHVVHPFTTRPFDFPRLQKQSPMVRTIGTIIVDQITSGERSPCVRSRRACAPTSGEQVTDRQKCAARPTAIAFGPIGSTGEEVAS